MTAVHKAPVRLVPSQAGTVPPGFVSVLVPKGCILLLSETEYLCSIQRSKRCERREALRRRAGGRR